MPCLRSEKWKSPVTSAATGTKRGLAVTVYTGRIVFTLVTGSVRAIGAPHRILDFRIGGEPLFCYCV